MIDPHTISKDDEEPFIAAMTQGDALALVIKAVILIEHQLIKFIEARTAAPKSLEKIALTYADRVHLAAALGLRSDLVRPLLALGTIRNKFAHRLDTSFSKSDADNFHETFPAFDKKAIEHAYAVTITKHGGPKSVATEEPLKRLVLCVISLRGALLAGRSEAQKA